MSKSRLPVAGALALGALLLVASCSDDAATDDTSTANTADTTAADPDQAAFIETASESCTATVADIDALLAESGEVGENPQPVVQGVAQHLRELYDQVASVEALELEVRDSTDAYLNALVAAIDEAEVAATTAERATQYLGSNPTALTGLHDAGKVLGIESCQIELAPSS